VSWPTISDTEIGVGLTLPDVRAAVSASLLTKMRARDRRGCQSFNTPSDISATLSGGTWPYNVDWTTVETLYLKPPANLRGSQGTTLNMELLLGITRAAGRNYTETVFGRIEIVGYQTILTAEGAEGSATFATFTATSGSAYQRVPVSGLWMHPISSGPTLVTVNLQLKIVSNAPGLLPAPTGSVTVARSRGAAHFIQADPR
jgi:hypothetical protein